MPKKDEGEAKRLTKADIDHFKKLLLEKRANLISQVKETLLGTENNEVKTSDEIDWASFEYDQSFEYRLRDREKFLLRKINKALERIEDKKYDLCENCDEPIGKKRLEARPETTLCIVCKESQERQEKMFQKKRVLRATMEF
jgi:DnaK suppressor protein